MVSLDKEYLLHVHLYDFCHIVSHMNCNDNNFLGSGGGGGEASTLQNTLGRTLPVWGFAEGFKIKLELWNLRRCEAGQRMLFDWNPSENFSEKALLNMEAIWLVKRGERLAADCILVPEIRSWNTLLETTDCMVPLWLNQIGQKAN